MPLAEFKLSTDWIPKLTKELANLRGSRRMEVSKIADELFIKPSELAPLFVEPDLQQFNPLDELDGASELFRVPAFKLIEEFVKSSSSKSDGGHQLFILGDAGMGKTSLLAMFKMAHINSFWPKGYKCVALKLGSNTLAELQKINSRDETLLLLDSLDEDPESFGRVKERITEILKETQNFLRVIITCRTQFFPKTEDRAFVRQDRLSISGFRCPVKYLSLFNDPQVSTYLNKKFTDPKTISDAAEIVNNINDLHCRPMLLSYIDYLITEREVTNNPYEIYEILVNAWLDRECRRKGVSLNKVHLLQACQVLARNMTSSGRLAIEDHRLESVLRNHGLLESITTVDVGGRSLLNKNSDGSFRFAHQSFQEFLVVQTLKDGLGWDFPTCSEMIATFMRSTSWGNIDLSDAILIGSNLKGVDMRFANIEKADLDSALLERANFEGANLVQANLENAVMDHASLFGASLSGANLLDASLEGVDFESANLEGATLSSNSILSVRNFKRVASIRGAKLIGSIHNSELAKWAKEHGAEVKVRSSHWGHGGE